MAGGHFAAKAIIGGQQSRQLEELTDVALRRAEIAVACRGPVNCDAASLQAFRFLVYQRSAVKDIRLLNRDGSVLCSAYSETLEFDNGWVERPNMLRSSDQRLLLFSVDRFNAAALGVLRDIGDGQSLVAILGLSSDVFDIMPAELRAHSEVLLELGDGSDVGRFSLKGKDEFSQLVEHRKASSRYPLQATIRVERSALPLWHDEAYWPAMLIALGLGLAFGLLVTRATAKLEGPVVDIDRGLARREFKPFYQPIFDLRTGDILGCEVLARWIREDGTIVPPMSFIPLVESSGRIEAMTWLILETALRELYPRLRENKHFKLSFNVVPRHLLSDGFVETLRRVVLAAKVSARQVVLELTERNELPDLGRAAMVVTELRELGFRVAMDDVGVGHSGLSQMKGLGANTIKIDKFFVDTITNDESAVSVVQMLVRLARDLGMAVIAEGIETSKQVQALLACGVEEGQGYIVSPPLALAKFDELLEIRRSKALVEAVVRQPALVA
jgi:sensor c-di-GMP phosphodiesterase-like protein